MRTAQPRRLRFGAAKKLSRGSNGPAIGFLNLNFDETIAELFPWDLQRYNGKFGVQYRRIIRSEGEYAEIEKWISDNSDVVFIRSLLTTCIAVVEHQSAPGVHTALGDLEYNAKYNTDAGARAKLCDALSATFGRLHGSLGINAICSVPSSKPGAYNLPALITAGLSEKLGIKDISNSINWSGPKPSLKGVDVDKK